MNTQTHALKYGLLACGGVIASLFFIVSCHHTQIKASVQSVLDRHSMICSGARTVTEGVGRMRGVDTSSCPNDFRAAYLSHIQAWEVLAEVEQKARKLKNESESARAFVEAFVRGLIMDPFGKANEMRAAENALEREAQAAKQQVMTTLNQVEQCALAYGASPSSR